MPLSRNVEGVGEMMLDARQHYAAPLSAERLFGWHAALFFYQIRGITAYHRGLMPQARSWFPASCLRLHQP